MSASIAAMMSCAIPAMADAALKGAVLLALAGLATAALWRGSAALRHLVWSLAMAGLLALPVLSALLPQWRVLPQWPALPALGKVAGRAAAPAAAQRIAPVSPSPAPAPRIAPALHHAPAPRSAQLVQETPFEEDILSGEPAPVPAPAPAATQAPRGIAAPPAAKPVRPWSDWVVPLWMLGAALMLVPIVAGRLALWRLSRSARPVASRSWTALLEMLTRQMRLRRSVILLESDRPVMPMAWGLRRGRVLVPAESENWSAERRRAVLLHEIAHVRRRDCLTQLLTNVACAMHWFNPLVWLARQRMVAERERACDDLVLAAGFEPSDYAEHLLRIAAGLRGGLLTSAAAIAMARSSGLEGRLLAVLDEKRNRRGLTRSLVLAGLTLTLIIAVPLACIAQQGPDANSPSGGKEAKTASGSLAAVPAESPAPGAAAHEGHVLHVLAPSPEYAAAYDPLAAEAGLRMTAMELASRYGAGVTYWPVERLNQLPADAWPRLCVSCEPASANLRRLRLTRSGDIFICRASMDGNDYAEVARYRIRLADSVELGLFVGSAAGESPVKAAFLDVRLNGKPFADYASSEIGDSLQPANVLLTADRWMIETHGSAAKADSPERGEFLHKRCTGDFEIEATIASCSGDASVPAALMCRPGAALDAPMVAACFNGREPGLAVRHGPLKSPAVLTNPGIHMAKVIWMAGPDQRREIAQALVSWENWDALTRSADALADRAAAAVLMEWKLAPRAAAAAATPADALKTLDAARDEALTANPDRILAAASQADDVLAKSPESPEAHCTAAICGAMLACKDLHGAFHDRPRFLASPLAHALTAARSLDSARPADRLSIGWVALACGYADAAQALAQPGLDAAPDASESRALKMFITRDYRPLTPETVMEAAPLEKLAWVWATQECDRYDLLDPVCIALALNESDPFLLPLRTGAGDVDVGHKSSMLGMRLALGRAAATLLASKEIPIETRRELAAPLADAAGVDPSDGDPLQVAKAIQAALSNGRPNCDLAAWLPPMMKLFAAASAVQENPVAPGPRWRTITQHDCADWERGLAFLALYDRFMFCSQTLGAPEMAYEFCNSIWREIGNPPGASETFASLGNLALTHKTEGVSVLKGRDQTTFVRRVYAAGVLTQNWELSGVPQALRSVLTFPVARGCWDWSGTCQTAEEVDQPESLCGPAWKALQSDAYGNGPIIALMKHTSDTSWADDARKRMPYDAELLVAAADVAEKTRQWAAVAGIMEQERQLTPTKAECYFQLANAYALMGDQVEAIATVEAARSNCEFSVGLSNVMAIAVPWLVEADRKEEALEWGKQAAQTGSMQALRAYAQGLDANGRDKEAIDVWRSAAQRYFQGVESFFYFLTAKGFTTDQLYDEMTALLACHKEVKEQFAQRFIGGTAGWGCKPELFERAFAGPLAFVSKADQLLALTRAATLNRQFEKATGYALQLQAVRPMNSMELLVAHACARLGAQANAAEQWAAALKKAPAADDFHAHVQFALGLSTADELLRACGDDDQKKAVAHWLIGVEAESRGDTASALNSYKAGMSLGRENMPKRAAKFWGKALEPPGKEGGVQ